MITPDVRVVPAGSSAERESHHETHPFGATVHMTSSIEATSSAPKVTVDDLGSEEAFLAAIDETIKYFNDGDIVSRCSGGLATCGNAHGKLVDALADRVPRKGAGSVVVGPSMIKLIGQTPSS